MKINSVAVIGGDMRQIACANAIMSEGCNVLLAGFDKLSAKNIESVTVAEAALLSEIIILPLPFTKDYTTLNAPFASEKIMLDDTFAKLMQGKKVFCPRKEDLLKTSKYWNPDFIHDFLSREEFAVLNAVPRELSLEVYLNRLYTSQLCLTATTVKKIRVYL